jgi:hypothetical protein
MARLASETKMGFYATSTVTVAKIIEKTIEFRENTFALDCCCGEGEVIEMFKEQFGCFNFAVELNDDRAKLAEARNINKVLNADALSGVRKSNRWVGFNFLNPPYDYAADGERLEHKFIERWGATTVEGGVMMLVINPSSVTVEIAKKLILQGYAPSFSVYDPENEDYKRFGQFFIVMKRVREQYRHDLDQLMDVFRNPVPLDKLTLETPIVPKTGMPPQMFKEINIPYWKLQELLAKSTLKKNFFDELRSGTLDGGSIEIPNEGQAAILIAAGKLNKKIQLTNGEEVILKGTVKKEKVVRGQMDDEGEVKTAKRTDVYSTVVYGLNLTRGCFIKYT